MFNNFGMLGVTPNAEVLVLFFILIVWSLVWKGLALWKAGRAGEKWWFIALLVVNTFGLFEIIYLFTEGRKNLRNILVVVLATLIIIFVVILPLSYRGICRGGSLDRFGNFGGKMMWR